MRYQGEQEKRIMHLSPHHTSSLVDSIKGCWKLYLFEGAQAIGLALLLTGIIYAFHLYPRIYNIFLLYLLAVLLMALRYGLYAAVILAIASFACIDFFFVVPFYTFAIKQFEEALSLLVFLATAIITGYLSSALCRNLKETQNRLNLALQERAERAVLREREMRVLYEVGQATNHEKSLEGQLALIARAIVDNFIRAGVQGCIIFLSNPIEKGRAFLQVGAPQSEDIARLLADKDLASAAESVIDNGAAIRFDIDSPFVPQKNYGYIRRLLACTAGQICPGHHYAHIIPVRTGQEIVGALLLLYEHTAGSCLDTESRWLSAGNREPDAQMQFLLCFLDHVASVAERARLQHARLEMKLWEHTKDLHASLVDWVSHGLRTPLTTIKGVATGVLQEETLLCNRRVRTALERIEHAADRLDRFADNLLDISSMKGGILRPRKVLYCIDALVAETLDDMQSVLSNRRVETCIPDIPPLELDPVLISHVLANLIENAVRYTPDTSPIEIDARIYGRNVLVSVADHGPGISKGDIQYLFNSFYRGSTARLLGKGLGLAVCRGLVEAHQGEIWVENREGGGAIFRFTLPCSSSEEEIQDA
jgi:two-component system sensor histidine kinase KdpD